MKKLVSFLLFCYWFYGCGRKESESGTASVSKQKFDLEFEKLGIPGLDVYSKNGIVILMHESTCYSCLLYLADKLDDITGDSVYIFTFGNQNFAVSELSGTGPNVVKIRLSEESFTLNQSMLIFKKSGEFLASPFYFPKSDALENIDTYLNIYAK